MAEGENVFSGKEAFEQKLKQLKTLTNGRLRRIGGDRTTNHDPWKNSMSKKHKGTLT